MNKGKKQMDEVLQTMIQTMREQYQKVCAPITQTTVRTEQWISAPDGKKMKTVIIKPVGIKEPYPTIVQRSCYYHTREFLEVQAEELAKRGFAAVYQWCRGIGGSEGEWEPYAHERSDGLPLLEWLQNEAWVKNIGYMGASYLAMTGWFLADIAPDKVKTMYLTVHGTEQHIVAWQEGAFRQDIYTSWTMENAGVPIQADYLDSARYCPQVEVDEALWGCHLEWYRDEISKPSPTDPYWTDSYWNTMHEVPGKMRMPIFLGEGWYDIHLGSSLQAFSNLSQNSAIHSVLQVNPGNHWLQPVIPGQKEQRKAVVFEHEQQLQWFKNILMDEQLPEKSVNYYLIGADEWRKYDTYPPKAAGEAEYYLDGEELAAYPNQNSTREYDYDPRNPVLSHGAETLFKTSEGVGSLEQPEPNWRPDVMSYVSQPLETNMDVIGTIMVRLWVQSDASDTCFTVKVMEVFPDGRAFNIRNGITTLAFRNGADNPQTYNGEPVEVMIKCWDIAWRLQKGSKLRLDISSSNFPEFSIHPNTSKVWSMETHPRIVHQAILSGIDYPSKIVLPLDNR